LNQCSLPNYQVHRMISSILPWRLIAYIAQVIVKIEYNFYKEVIQF